MGESAVVRIRTPPVFLHVDGKSINRELTDGSKRSRAPRTRPRAASSRNTSRSCSRTRVAALYYGFDTRTVVLASAATKWNRRSLGEYRRALGTMVVASAGNRGPTAGAITFPGGLPQYHPGRQHRHRRPRPGRSRELLQPPSLSRRDPPAPPRRSPRDGRRRHLRTGMFIAARTNGRRTSAWGCSRPPGSTSSHRPAPERT